MGGHFDLENKQRKIKELEEETIKDDFWSKENSQDVMQVLSELKNEIKSFSIIKEKISYVNELSNIELSESDLQELRINIEEIKKELDILKLAVLLNGEFDSNNAYIEIHSGAGGTESNDWAAMLKRMYLRYFEKKNYKYDIISEQSGEEVGIKGILIHVKARNAFGYLKGETGVHRLVRISPFDSNKRRHTSFASVLVTPEISTKIELDIKEKDLKIDVYRSSGAGGQSVNTTDSAVRITHLPTGIVVTCQNERSQIKNKEKAIEILKGKLYLLEKEDLDDKIKNLKGSVMDVNFGNQIRNYVMCPYNLVKDLRTDIETSNVEDVLDGELDLFIESYLKHN